MTRRIRAAAAWQISTRRAATKDVCASTTPGASSRALACTIAPSVVASETDFGIRAHFENQDRLQQNGDTPAARTGVLVESNVRTNAAYAGFVQNRFLFGGWTVTPGVRLEHVQYERTNRLANAGAGVTGDTELTRLIPGVGVSHTTGEQVTVFAGIHRGFAPPRTEDIISNTGGVVELDPELSWNYEAGARSALRPGVGIDATFFRMDYENQIVPASLAGGVGATLTNGGATLHQGVELRAQIDSAPITNSAHDIYLRVRTHTCQSRSSLAHVSATSPVSAASA
jgi:Fe(3+) dicitrate transport protein